MLDPPTRGRPWSFVEGGLLLPVVLQALNLTWNADPELRAAVSNVLQALASAGAAVLLALAARRMHEDQSSAARGWTLVAAGATTFALGMTTFMIVEVALGDPPYPSVADIFFVPSYPLLIIGFLRLPREASDPSQRLGHTLDLGALALIAAPLIWQFNLHPLLDALREDPSPAVQFSLVYTALDTSLLLVLWHRTVRRFGQGQSFVPMMLLTLGGFCLITGDLFVGYISTLQDYSSGSVIDMSWVLWSSLCGLSGLHLLRYGTSPSSAPALSISRNVWAVGLTYLWVVLVFLMLIVAVLRPGTFQIDTLIAATVGALVLAVTRQIGSLKEAASLNERLREARTGLEEKVRDRTKLLHESEAQFRTLVETTNEWIWSMDGEGRYSYCNPTVERLLGHPPSALVGMAPAFVMVPEDAQAFVTQMAEKKALGVGWTGLVLRFRHADGSTRHFESNAVPLLDAEGNHRGFQGADRDVTDRVQVEREREGLQVQLMHAQKMEAVGQLAGGVAHDFNNMLTALMSHIDLARYEHEPDGRQEYLDEMQKVAERAAGLTRQLLLFSRRHVPKKRPVDLEALLEDSLQMLRRLIGENVALHVNLGREASVLVADPGMMEQVFLNLLVNARDAMPGGGNVRISTSAVEVRVGIPPESEARPGRFVRLDIEDEGVGMDEATRGRIFEPFFTTKKEGQGTGLGLSTVYGIVRQHGGFVRVDSDLGRGSKFHVFLPLADDVQVPPSVRSANEPDYRGTERILLVEDEPTVRENIELALQARGYRVSSAASGVDAREMFGARPDAFDLVLTDLVMPGGVNGLDLMDELRSRVPELRVILMSGYSAEVAVRGIVETSVTRFMQKPFKPSDLCRTIRECLDVPEGRRGR